MAQQYPLDALLQVRVHRENRAKSELAKARNIEEEARDNLLQAKEEFQNYREWRLLEEKSRYDAIIGKACTKQDFDDLKNGLAKLEIHEAELDKKVMDAKQNLQQAQEQVHAAKDFFLSMQKDKEKINAHKDIWQESLIKEEMLLEDKETEDFNYNSLQ